MALPFLNDNLINLYSDVLTNQETAPQEFNEDNVFRIPQEYLLSDSNIYTDPNTIDVPVEATQDGIASVNTGLPMYIRDDNDNRFLQYGGVDNTDDLIRNYKAATQERTNRLTNPNKIQELINSGIEKIGIDPRRSIGEMMKSGQVDERKFRGIPSVSGILAQVLPDKYYDMSLNDQVFTQAMMGYTGPTVFGKNTGNQDPFGINVRSGLGNYAEAVAESFDNLDKQLGGRLAEKYGATFDPNTGKFTGPGAERANQMTKMMRKKYNFQKNQMAVKNTLDATIKDIRERKAKEAAALANAAKQKANIPATPGFDVSGGAGGSYDRSFDYSGASDKTASDSKRTEDRRSSDLGFSDIRLKENVELIGKSPSNINIYKFNYKDNPTTYQGAMAHEVPWASVKHSNGYMMIDYNKIDVEFKLYDK